MVVHLVIGVFIAVSVCLSVILKKLSLPAALAGGFIASCIYPAAGITGILMLGAFFISATLATKWKIEKKATIGAAEKNKGERTIGQVLANGGLAGIAAMVAIAYPPAMETCRLLLAAALASASADTARSARDRSGRTVRG